MIQKSQEVELYTESHVPVIMHKRQVIVKKIRSTVLAGSTSGSSITSGYSTSTRITHVKYLKRRNNKYLISKYSRNTTYNLSSTPTTLQHQQTLRKLRKATVKRSFNNRVNIENKRSHSNYQSILGNLSGLSKNDQLIVSELSLFKTNNSQFSRKFVYVNSNSVFEPRVSSTPVFRMQRTSTPKYLVSNKTKIADVFYHLPEERDVFKFEPTSNSTTVSYRPPEIYNRGLTSHSTPKKLNDLDKIKFKPEENFTSTLLPKKKAVKTLMGDSTVVSKMSDVRQSTGTNSVSSVIKCCIKPLKQLIFGKISLKRCTKNVVY